VQLTPRLTLLVTSPRVAPGLLSWAAWSAVASAPRRLASDLGSPLARAVAAAGHPVEALPAATVEAVLAAAADGDLVWLADDAEAESFPAALAGRIVDGSAVEVEVLHASYDVPGARLLDLVTVMDRLRTDCPWDREQTHRSLARYLLEETHETLEAIDLLEEGGDPDHLREELGDLLLQVVFHARVAAEVPEDEGGFTIDDVAGGIVDKLVHRHPHVFAGLDVADADEVERNWDALKAAEKRRASVLDGLPPGLPALALADKVLGRAAKVGVVPEAPDATVGPSLGDRLLAVVVEARAAGLDPEQELRGAVRRVADRVRSTEPSPPGGQTSA
jgi:XTP/dITP diphosphohydrolase